MKAKGRPTIPPPIIVLKSAKAASVVVIPVCPC